MEFPYQLATFLNKEPATGEAVYGGDNGWYPQIALKRRFKLIEIGEDELLARLEAYCAATLSFTIQTGDLVKPERMPVQVIEVEQSQELMNFHTGFIAAMGDSMRSRYPERDGDNYLPHITAEYGEAMVLDSNDFIQKQFFVQNIWLLKDVKNEDSIAYKKFGLGRSTTAATHGKTKNQ